MEKDVLKGIVEEVSSERKVKLIFPADSNNKLKKKNVEQEKICILDGIFFRTNTLQWQKTH